MKPLKTIIMTTKSRSIKTVALIAALFLSAAIYAQSNGKAASKAEAAKPTTVSVQSNGRGTLKSGAAKVDITHTEQELQAAK